MEKVVLVTNIPNQYRIPLFNELNKQFKEKGKELHVIFGALSYKNRKTIVDLSACEFDYQILKTTLFFGLENKTGFLFYGGLLKSLKKLKANRLIVAGYSFATIKIWASTFFRKRAYYIWSGSIRNKEKEIGSLRKFQRKQLIKRAKGYLSYGTLAKQNFADLGAKAAEITVIGNTVDTGFFGQETTRIRTRLAQESQKHLTYVGYLTPRKNVQQLTVVLKELLQIRKDIMLDIVGDGESMTKLKSVVKENNLENYVTFHGFKQKEELPKYLAISNCFLFQTDFDIWGLVLNEAMASGIPCLSSVNAGATEDLIKEGITGFKVNFEESKQVAEKINWILNNPTEMTELASRAENFITTEYSLSKCAERIVTLF
jgi:glycosyltransferase involved in cell wall biosynthesis